MSEKHFLFDDDQLERAEHLAQLLRGCMSMQEVRTVFESDAPYHRALWSTLAAQGWLGLALDERHGGAGLALGDLCLVAEQLGRAMAPVPFVAHVAMAMHALARHGDESLQADWLSRCASGSVLATFAWREAGSEDLRATPAMRADGGVLNGSKVAVAYGGCADIAIVSAGAADGVGLYLVDLRAPGVSVVAGESLDPALDFATLVFRDAPAQRLHNAPLPAGAVQTLLHEAAIVDAFLNLGSASAVFEVARAYAIDRFAFGRPIGAFQAIRHKAARMFESLAIARANCHFGAWAVRKASPLLGLASASAHIAATEAFSFCARENIRIHGGISATWVHDCHLYYRRAKVASLLLGNAPAWNRILVDELLANEQDLSVDLSEHDGQQEIASLREEIRAWIRANLPSDDALRALSDDERFAFVRDWHRRKAAAGWACPQWPVQYGGKGWSPDRVALWQDEEGEALREMSFPMSIIDIAGPVLMGCATEAQKQRFLPKMQSAEEFWCMLFSEPHGGSDVAALRTRAVRDGDEWVVNGQKVWTSAAHHADFGLLLARTDPTVAKHKGLTYFIVDMHAPGVTVRRLKQITGNAEFCEVFFDDVRIPDANRLGEPGGGWRIAMATLQNEKVALRSFRLHLMRYLQAAKTLTLDGRPAVQDSAVQEKLKHYTLRYWSNRFIEFQGLHAAMHRRLPGHEESVTKLTTAATNLDIASAAMDLYGAQCFEGGAARSEELRYFEYLYFHYVGVSMGGGTEEILLNLIGDAIGMPPEPRLEKDVPFNQLRVGGSERRS